MAVGVDRPARVLVRVDERGEGGRRLEAFVEAQAEFAQEGQVRAETGQHDHLVHRVQAAPVLTGQDHTALGVPLDGLGAETGDRVRVPLLHGGLRREAQGTAGG